MKYIEVEKTFYTDPQASYLAKTDVGDMWLPLRPDLMQGGSIKERLMHWLGYHFSYGQPYCVMCGLKERRKR